LFVCCQRVGQLHVVAKRKVEEDWVLVDLPNVISEVFEFDVFQIEVIPSYRPCEWFVEPGQDFDQRRLPAPRFAHNGSDFVRFKTQVDAVKDFLVFLGVLLEVQILDVDADFFNCGFLGICVVGNHILVVNELVEVDCVVSGFHYVLHQYCAATQGGYCHESHEYDCDHLSRADPHVIC